MNDQEFREAYQPLHVPAHYDPADTLQNKVVFALAQTGEGTAAEVAQKMEELEPSAPEKQVIASVHETLTALEAKGLISVIDNQGDLRYHLHKITQPNQGRVNPEKLAPGLD